MDAPSSSLELRHAATDRVSAVVVPARRLLAIEGTGPPTASGYEMAALALRGASLALAASVVRAGHPAPPRPAAEALWWPNSDVAPDELVPTFHDRRRWRWAQLLAVPEQATEAQAAEAIDSVRRSAGRPRALIALRELTEGWAVQILALGGTAAESAAYAQLVAHLEDGHLSAAGPVHVIHLTAPDLVPIERRRSIVRVPARQ